MDVRTLPRESTEWVAYHIFYPASPRPVILDCIRPLVESLREDDLIDGYFFINYWLEGGHIRLRLRPAQLALKSQVCDRATEAISAFLTRRPSLYDYDITPLQQMYDAMFVQEFTEAERRLLYNGASRMPIRDGNSFDRFAYEPEYAKYGGLQGIRLAERHFEFSSDLVIDLLGSTNSHMRSVLLGTSIQLMYVILTSFLPSAIDQQRFLHDYHEFWARSADGNAPQGRAMMTEQYGVVGEKLSVQLKSIDALIAAPDTGAESSLGRWAEHCSGLASEVRNLAKVGGLMFPQRDKWTTDGSSLVRSEHLDFVADPDSALGMLLFPFMHMTNNRLSISNLDEAYLSKLLLMAISDDDMTRT